jgi:hypothetical protein
MEFDAGLMQHIDVAGGFNPWAEDQELPEEIWHAITNHIEGNAALGAFLGLPV